MARCSVGRLSSAMMSTTLLNMMLCTVHFPAVVYKMSVELSGWTSFITKLKSTLALARHTVNVVRMLAILLIGAWMHALQIDSKHDDPQRWTQVRFYDCITSVCVQTLLAILMPFCTECECKESPSENDVVFVMEIRTLEAVVTAIRYSALLGLRGEEAGHAH